MVGYPDATLMLLKEGAFITEFRREFHVSTTCFAIDIQDFVILMNNPSFEFYPVKFCIFVLSLLLLIIIMDHVDRLKSGDRYYAI